jgi:hypothetical protein
VERVQRFEDLLRSLAAGDRRSHPGGAARPIVLRVGQFADQQDLLHFAHRLEQSPELIEVSLTRADMHDAWFAVRADAVGDVIAALAHLDGYEIATEVHDTSVEASIVYRAGTAARRVAQAEPISVLPPRQRFRVFRHEPEAEAPAAKTNGHPSVVRRFWDVFGEPVDPITPHADVQHTRPSLPDASPPAPATAPPAPPIRPAVTPPSSAPAGPPRHLGADDRAAGSEGAPEHLTVVAYPFDSFQLLTEFQAAVQSLPGVTATRVLRFYRGTLHLAVDREGHDSPLELLRHLEGFELRVALASPRHIEVELLMAGATTSPDTR